MNANAIPIVRITYSNNAIGALGRQAHTHPSCRGLYTGGSLVRVSMLVSVETLVINNLSSCVCSRRHREHGTQSVGG